MLFIRIRFSRRNPPPGYYHYLYLREDGSPYYSGKGKGKRAWSTNHSVKLPKDQSLIIITHWGLTELWALGLERWHIRWYGRKDNGTGILRNMTDGGEGALGLCERKGVPTGRTSEDFTDEWKKNLSLGSKGKCAGEKNGMYGQIGKNTGKKVYNNGTQEYYFIPGKQTPGFVPGRIPGGTIGNKKGLRWYNNGVITKQFREGLQPEGFVNGRIRK